MVQFLKRNGIALLIVCMAVIFVCIGILRNEHTTVWRKAVNICMECIGIG